VLVAVRRRTHQSPEHAVENLSVLVLAVPQHVIRHVLLRHPPVQMGNRSLEACQRCLALLDALTRGPLSLLGRQPPQRLVVEGP